MMKSTLLLLSLGLGGVVFAEDAQKLKFDFEPGKTYTIIQEANVSMEMKNPMTQEAMDIVSDTTIEFSTDVAEDPKGEKVTVTIDRFAMKTIAGGMPPMSYDSADESAQNSPLASMMKGILGMSSGAIFDDKGNVVESFEAHDNVPAAQIGVTSDQLIEGLEQALLMFPDKALSVGDTWTIDSKMSMGGVAAEPIEVKYSYKLEGYENLDGNSNAKISFSVEMDGSIEMGGMAMSIKAEKFDGVLWHDTNLNVTRKMESEMKMQMSVPEGTPMGAGALGDIPYAMKIKQELKSVE